MSSQKSEFQREVKRWQVKELHRSRRIFFHSLAIRPWIPTFYYAMLRPADAHATLDVGCGTGFLTRLVAQKVPDNGVVVGIDINIKLIRTAKKEKQVNGAHISNNKIEYLVADAYHLPFRSNALDLVCCQTVLMWLARPLAALREMARTCRIDGRVACIEPDWGMCTIYDTSDHAYARMAKRAVEAEIRGRRRLYRQDSTIGRKLPDLLLKAGLTNIVADGIFSTLNVRCDPRVSANTLKSSYISQLKLLSDPSNSERLNEYIRVLRRGGLSSSQVRGCLKLWEARLRRYLRSLRSRGKDPGLTAVPLYVSVGQKNR